MQTNSITMTRGLKLRGQGISGMQSLLQQFSHTARHINHATYKSCWRTKTNT